MLLKVMLLFCTKKKTSDWSSGYSGDKSYFLQRTFPQITSYIRKHCYGLPAVIFLSNLDALRLVHTVVGMSVLMRCRLSITALEDIITTTRIIY